MALSGTRRLRDPLSSTGISQLGGGAAQEARLGTLEAQEVQPPQEVRLQEVRLEGDVLDRLTRLRRVLPLLGEELASARREAARLRVENRKLLARLRHLEAGFSGAQRERP